MELVDIADLKSAGGSPLLAGSIPAAGTTIVIKIELMTPKYISVAIFHKHTNLCFSFLQSCLKQ
jgi:hypothetical protein